MLFAFAAFAASVSGYGVPPTPCASNPLFHAPCPSLEFQQIYQLASSGPPGPDPPTVASIRAADKGIADNFVKRKPNTEHFYGGVRCLVFGLELQTNVSGRYVVYAHGGGFISGSPADVQSEFLHNLAVATGATVIGVDYDLAPENGVTVPHQTMQLVSVFTALLQEGVPASNIAVGGDSAGGGLVLTVMQKLRRMGAPLPQSAVLLHAWTDLSLSGRSITERAHLDPFVTNAVLVVDSQTAIGNRDIDGNVIADNDPTEPQYSALFGSFRGLPPAYYMVGTQEVLYSDTIRAFLKHRRAARGRCEVVLAEKQNMVHLYGMLLSQYPEAGHTLGQIAAFINKHWHTPRSW